MKSYEKHMGSSRRESIMWWNCLSRAEMETMIAVFTESDDITPDNITVRMIEDLYIMALRTVQYK